jgi:bacteriocin-like protein
MTTANDTGATSMQVESTRISPQPGAENKKKSTELSEQELKKVSGGYIGETEKNLRR